MTHRLLVTKSMTDSCPESESEPKAKLYDTIPIVEASMALGKLKSDFRFLIAEKFDSLRCESR